jgi:VanZ family protein
MSKATQIVLRWLPALLMMFVIFLFSAQPSSDLPIFDWADRLVKKGGHMVGYALLAFAYWRGLQFKQERWWLAWRLVILYAVTDEFHQSFVPGRSPSVWDVLVYDNLGALMSLWLFSLYKVQRSDLIRPIAEGGNAQSQ